MTTRESFGANRLPRPDFSRSRLRAAARCALALFLQAIVISSAAIAATPREVLEEAAREYHSALDCTDHEKRLATFRRAELLFERLADGAESTGPPSSEHAIANADLYVNLGNAALGAERLGPAILAYRRALLLDPDHHRARQNLVYARSLLADWVPRPEEEEGWFDTFFAWSRRRSPDKLRISAAAAFLLTASLLGGAIRWRQAILRNLAILSALVWLSLVTLLLFGSRAGSAQPAVVIVPEVVARSADSSGAPARFSQPLPGGTELEVIEIRDAFCQVRLYDGRDAWLPASALEMVKPL
jgi:tetratricopeptide (TPR) repeat protein